MSATRAVGELPREPAGAADLRARIALTAVAALAVASLALAHWAHSASDATAVASLAL